MATPLVVQKHFQFSNWYLELVAVEVSKTAMVRGAGLFSVKETRDTRVTMHAENKPYVDAYRSFRDRALAMGREAGLEWTIK